MNPTDAVLPVSAPELGQKAKALDPLELMLGSSGVVMVVLVILVIASTMVWLIWLLKSAQLRRLLSANRQFEGDAERIGSSSELIRLAQRDGNSPAARVVHELAKHQHLASHGADYLLAVAKRAIAGEQQRALVLMPTLQSIASASPFIGLFGTVWGIMDAFLRIGVEKSASLPVVAPAIGEALIATAFGLVAAIPATIGFNYVDKRITDLMEELGASAEAWARLFASGAARPRGPFLGEGE